MVCQQYSLTTRNCQHFALNLMEFLQGSASLEAVRAAIENEKTAALITVQHDWTYLPRLSDEMRNDEEIVLTSVMEHYAALDLASDELKQREDLQLVAALRYLLESWADESPSCLARQRALAAISTCSVGAAHDDTTIEIAALHLLERLGKPNRDLIFGRLLICTRKRLRRTLFRGEATPPYSSKAILLLSELGAQTCAWMDFADEMKSMMAVAVPCLRGHTDRVTGVAVFPDGSNVVTASNDKTAIVWDVASGQKWQKLQGPTRCLMGVAVFPDGSKVVTVYRDKTAIVWDVASGQKLQKLQGHTNWLMGVAVFPDGSKVVTASGDRQPSFGM